MSVKERERDLTLSGYHHTLQMHMQWVSINFSISLKGKTLIADFKISSTIAKLNHYKTIKIHFSSANFYVKCANYLEVLLTPMHIFDCQAITSNLFFFNFVFYLMPFTSKSPDLETAAVNRGF